MSSDAALLAETSRVFEADVCVSGVRNACRQVRREGIRAPSVAVPSGTSARCTAARLMRAIKLQGAVRGRTVPAPAPDPAAACPLDRVRRQFKAPRPNALWVSGFTDVATWAGVVHAVAFVGGAAGCFGDGSPSGDRRRRLRPGSAWPRGGGGHASPSAGRCPQKTHAGVALDALEQALRERQPIQGGSLAHHSDRGSHCLALRDIERLPEAGVDPSVGSAGDSCENALAGTVNGLLKAKAACGCEPWRCFETVEYATLGWAAGHDTRRLLEPIGNLPPAEAEAACSTEPEARPMAT